MVASLVHCEGIVLKNLRHGETSRIATLFTRELGRIGVIAKGARAPLSPFGASLEHLNLSSFVLYHRPGRDLQFLKSGTLEREFRGLQRRAERYRLASALAEFLDRVLTGEEAAPELFAFAVRALEVLESAPAEALPELFRGMQLRVASLLGYAPHLERCLRCGREVPPASVADATAGRPWRFLSAEGGAACPACAEAMDPAAGPALTPRALRRLRAMARGASRSPSLPRTEVREAPDSPATGPTPAPAAWQRTLDLLVEEFLRYHFESYRGLRSLESLSQGPARPGA
jgi:DNA repair protein RecO (recombination protein O)